jgi:hypothetical protein
MTLNRFCMPIFIVVIELLTELGLVIWPGQNDSLLGIPRCFASLYSHYTLVHRTCTSQKSDVGCFYKTGLSCFSLKFPSIFNRCDAR